jgi:cytochrome c biogenesis protein CcmG/thiol:disulfide interchange protein DsbE
VTRANHATIAALSGIMRGMTKPYALAALALLSLFTAACGAPAQLHPLIGKPAPEISAEPIGGEGPTRIKAALGKVVILDFWATSCVPCKKSFPAYQEIVDEFPGRVAVIAVSVNEADNTTKSQLLAFASEVHAKFAIVWDKDGSVATRYGGSLSLPSAFVIDQAGAVRHLHLGYVPGYGAALAREVKALLDAGGK